MPLTADERLKADLSALLGGVVASRFAIGRRTPMTDHAAAMRLERLDLVRADAQPVRAILAGPVGGWVDRPAVLYCHAHGFDYTIGATELFAGRHALTAPPYAEALAEAGVVSLSVDMPCFGERANVSESECAKRHLWRGTTLFGEMLADLSGALGLLGAIEGVDRSRIGAFGISMGATLAFWLGALDRRIQAVAHLCCFADLATLVDAGAHDLHGIYMVVPGLLARARTGEIAGLIAPRPQLVGLGATDPLTPPAAIATGLADLRAAYARQDAGSALQLVFEPSSGHAETPAMRAAVLEFFRQTLGGAPCPS